MPKVKMGTRALDDNYRYIMAHALVDTPAAKMCKLLGISESCLYMRKRKPEFTTVRELRILRNTGRITDEQLLSIIRDSNDD